MLKSYKFIRIVAGLIISLCLCQGAVASYAVPDKDIGTGTIQAVNYAEHTITVAGHVYKISSKASYASGGAKNFEGLQPGMQLRFIANGSTSNPASRIISITVLPPKP